MITNYPYKFRLEPSPEQFRQLRGYAFTCRFIFNLALDQRKLATSPDPLPTLLEMWEKRQEDKEKEEGKKRERKETDYESEGKKEIVHKGINYYFQSPQMTIL